METTIIYLLKSAGLLAIFFLFYQLLLKKDTSFSLNRKFLVGGIFASFILPAIYFTRKVLIEAPVINAEFSPEMFPSTSLVQEAEINWWNLAGITYLVGAGLLLCQFAFRLFSILKLIKTHHSEKAEGFKFIKINRITGPFSFFHYIIYNPASHSQRDLELILQHEKVHAAQLHSLDIILANLTTAILWFNPFSWWYKKTIEQNLEFLADRETITAAGSRKAYQRALVKVSVPEFQPALTNHFYQSFIKKRIVMLNKKQNNKPKMWKISLVLPALMLFMFFFNVKTEAQILQKEEISSEKSSETQTLDSSQNEENEEDPLYVLNGVPSKKAIIDTIHPENIQKVNVLKGAKATALYGSSGRQGAVLISTKASESYIESQNNNPENVVKIRKISGTINQDAKLIIVNGKIKEDDFNLDSIDPETIERIEVVKGEKAISGYGEKAKNGVINVVLKDSERNPSSEAKTIKRRKQKNSTIYGTGKKTADNTSNQQEEKPLVILDGKVMPQSYDFNDVEPSEIVSINVLKGATATEKYGEKAKNGVIEIFTKTNNENNSSGINSESFSITSESTSNDLAQIEAYLKKEKDLKTKFSKIRRNKEGLITSIKIEVSGKGSTVNGSYSSTNGIPDVQISWNDKGSISINSKD
ncbi:TonB-dependent receptor plug domain-containing protein [Zunongwangia sp. F260]|uniref:TonB-dependent receptor plug domain-containing protein n=1 Tax=Autumnicola lenta TaxID=3075593 RepID=A0ABU3CK90_9FLAO|nr:TonB-dependent receptor plug domain-containing protein [Zunongwangia sp. F260]MDT0646763.1 TonB-dependent receptor plug domain-containing protein [Zunongwangia sp. F260]